MRRILTVVIFVCSHLLADVEKKVEPARHKIGVCIVAMDEYEMKAKELIESGRKFFCINHDVAYFIFTDGEKLHEANDLIKVRQENFGWPYVTLKRFQVYEEHAKLFEKMDYLFAVDADLVFVAPVGEEVLSDLVATQHPAFLKKRGDYENKKISAAYVGPHEGKHYFSCSLYGGRKNEFLNLVKEARKRVDADLEKKFISRWHDQSYLNRYLIDHPPTRILNPSYCYPEDWQLEYPKKLVASGKSAKKTGRK
jgi:histo-blood group ABO system transferase